MENVAKFIQIFEKKLTDDFCVPNEIIFSVRTFSIWTLPEKITDFNPYPSGTEID